METPQVAPVEQTVVPTQEAVPALEPVAPTVEPVQAVEVVPTEPVELRRYTLKVDGKDVEVDENELIELGQKGFHFDSRMQSLSAVEKQRAQNDQIAQAVLQNPVLAKALTLGTLL